MTEPQAGRSATGILHLGAHAVRIQFDRAALARRGFERLYLSQTTAAPYIGDIDYVMDETVADLIRESGPDNAVAISRPVSDPRRFELYLKVFNQFTVALARTGSRITVRYPSQALMTYLLDDVLQAALQPFLEELGGFILHGSCLVKNGIGMALMGNSGSGKSTTAFNLVRAGYHCYADDAIVVTPQGQDLYAWPFSREMSIRPLSFQLLQSHGFTFSGYRQEGKKYYFQQPDVPDNAGARLHYACLIAVGGEQDTEVRRLSREEFHTSLLGEQRYFSFVNREHHDRYAAIVIERIPEAMAVHLGQDLPQQIRVFDALIDPTRPRPSALQKSVDGLLQQHLKPSGRGAHLELLRNAWRSPGREPLRNLIPLLANSDLKVFKNALAFFQNFPLAQLEPGTVAGGWMVQRDDAASTTWLRLPEWLEGCRRLMAASCHAGYDQYATGWFKSAPILYAFLHRLAEPGSAEQQAIAEAWSRYLRDTSMIAASAPIVILAERAPAHGVRDGFVSNTGGRSWVYLSGKDRDAWHSVLSGMAVNSDRRIIILPIFTEGVPDFACTLACVRVAQACGLEPRVASLLPLCWLDDNDVAFLLEHRALAAPRETPDIAVVLDMLRSTASAFDQITWGQDACNGRGGCILHDFGLCAGGYFVARTSAQAEIVRTSLGDA